MTEQERIEFRKKLRRWRMIAILSIWGIAGLGWGIMKWAEKREQRAVDKIYRTAKAKLAGNPMPFDYYEFQTESSDNRPWPMADYARPLAKILKTDGPNVWLVFHHETRKWSESAEDLLAIFGNKKARFDTILLQKTQLLQAVERDSFTVNLRDTAFRIVEILEIKRLNGPHLQVRGHSNSSVTLRNNGLEGTVLSIENIRGAVEFTQPAPFQTGDEPLKLRKIEDVGDLEFLIKGKSKTGDDWVNRIFFRNRFGYSFVE